MRSAFLSRPARLKQAAGLIGGLFFSFSFLFAQDFSDVNGLAFPGGVPAGRSEGAMVWGDIDNDGDLDLIMTGEVSSTSFLTSVYRNNNGVLSLIVANGILIDVTEGALALEDYDLDGDLDLFITGRNASNNRVAALYFNDGNGTFSNDPTGTPAFTPVSDAAVAWGDYDHDGDPDLLVSGFDGAGLTISLYNNNGNSLFIRDQVESNKLTAVRRGSLDWGDYDGNGTLDLLVTGTDPSGLPFTRIYSNDGTGVLSFVSASLPNVREGNGTWADYDLDGDLDVLLTGQTTTGRISRVYRNNGGSFGNLINLTALEFGEARWADYDNDGYPDVVLGGSNGSGGRLTQLWRNTNGTGFANQTATSAVLADLDDNPSYAFGDYDGDQKLDLAVMGQVNGLGAKTFVLYRNLNASANTSPPVPALGTVTQNGLSTTFNWTAVPNARSYNLYIGTVAGTDGVLPARADLGSGFRRLARFGRLQGNSWTINNLSSGSYVWSVQSVDPDFEGSPFAAEGTFTVQADTSNQPLFSDVTGTSFAPLTSNNNPGGVPAGMSDTGLAWGDYDNDGDLDFVMVGATNTTSGNIQADISIYEYDQVSGRFFRNDDASNQLPDVWLADVAWGDCNNDGFLDLIVSGQFPSVGAPTQLTQIYLNNGNRNFSTASIGAFPDVRGGSLDWGDYDNDGDLDLLITGNAGGRTTEIWENTTNTGSFFVTFVRDNVASNQLQNVEFGDAVFGDYDRDGDLDIALSGNADSGPFTRIYKNDGTDSFSPTNFPLANVRQSSLIWTDINNDGYLDLILSGNASAGSTFNPTVRIYRYFRLSASFEFFADVQQLEGLANGSIDAGDFDNDGAVDLLLTGQTDAAGSNPRTLVYKNNGIGTFAPELATSNVLTNVTGGSEAVWGDYDGDQKLDILLTGSVNSSSKVFKLYRNVDTNPNSSPAAPQNLLTDIEDFDVKLSWSPPPGGGPVDGYTYALYIDGPVAGDQDIRSSHSEVPGGSNEGYRRVVHLGELGPSLSFTAKNLSPGVYRWSVQAVDQDLEGSVFASEQTFEYEDPSFTDVTDTRFPGLATGRWQAATAWGDLDQNGYLDLVVTGSTVSGNSSEVFLYDPTNSRFVRQPVFSAEIDDVGQGSLALQDFNRDGFLDLALTGESGGVPVTQVYPSVSGAFTAANRIDLTGLVTGNVAWGDYDNDGRVDLLVTGADASNTPRTLLFRNTGNSSTPFVEVPVSLPGIERGHAAWGDYNRDGYLDVLISGQSAGGAVTRLFPNDRNGDFGANVLAAPGLIDSYVTWSDYNADGLYDALIMGELPTTGAPRTLLYRQQANGSFSDQSASLRDFADGEAAFGDYDNDGYADLLLCGRDGLNATDRKVAFFRYDQAGGAFVEDTVAAAAFDGVNDGGVIDWVDYDRNGKLDVFLLGRTGEVPITATFALFDNINPASPTSPGDPKNLFDKIEGYEIVMSWEPPSNVPAAIARGLSYNVRVGTTSGAIDLQSPLANLTNGTRRIVWQGTVHDTTAFRLKNLPPDTYFWSVQAIDADYEGGPFAAERSIEYDAPTFIETTEAAFSGFPAGLDEGTLVWADVDQDEDLDLLALGATAGGRATRLYRNDGDGSFTLLNVALADVSQAAAAWADIDNDGDLDLALAGQSASGPITRIYRNDGSTTFTALQDLAGVVSGELAWGDFDYDGDPDLLVTGDTTGTGFTGITRLFRNDGSGNFTQVDAGLEGLIKSAAAWGDYNRDGFVDLLVMGENAQGNPATILYQNDGNDGFVAWLSSGLDGFRDGSAAWGDYDRDGYPDLLLSGEITNGLATRIYRNRSATNNSFAQVGSVSLPGVSRGEAIWGDFDNDNRSDILLTGETASGSLAALYQNTTGGFVPRPIGALPLQSAGKGAAVALGDYNGDQKLDLALLGETQANGRVLRLYQNVDSFPNLQPLLPLNLNQTVAGDTVILSWSAPAGANGSSYNVYVGSSPGATDIVSPAADQVAASATTGYRRLVQTGNAGQNLRLKLSDLADGTYYWSVQTIGPDFEGSNFAAEQSFTFTAPELVDVSALAFDGSVTAGLADGRLRWADVDRDGDLDLLVTGETGSTSAITQLLENRDGTFVRFTGQNFANLRYSAAAWADFDLDGSPDLLLLGETTAGIPVTKLYRNDGNGLLSEDPLSDELLPLRDGDVAWGDYDNDGDPDLLLTGLSSSGPRTLLYRNERGSGFTLIDAGFEQVYQGSADWGDYDQDGDLDLLLTGLNSNGFALHSKIYENRGARGGFRLLSTSEAPLTPVKGGHAVWGDYNRDGFLDLVIIGETTVSQVAPVAHIYQYAPGSGRFQRDNSISLLGVRDGEAAWGDYNDDGYLDLLLCGKTGPGINDRATRLYQNDGNGGLLAVAATNVHLPDINQGSSLAWGDYDGDGKLDMALLGRTSSGRSLFLYRNREATPNVVPNAPRNPALVVDADSVRFSWDAPTGAAANEMTYRLSVARTGGGFIQSPEADTLDGYRWIPGPGTRHHQLAWSLRNFPMEAGSYFWRVQAIGADLEGSAFTASQAFTFEPPHFVDASELFFEAGNAPGGLTEASLAWGDYDRDGDLDLVVAGRDAANTPQTWLFTADNDQGLVLNVALSNALEGVAGGQVAWADIDNDGLLDLAVSGTASSGAFSAVYLQQGGTFSAAPAYNSALIGLSASRLAWGDYNSDGRVDLLLAGLEGATPRTFLFRNTGTGLEATTASLPGLSGGGLRWADLNLDGKPEAILAGVTSGGTNLFAIYEYTQFGTFEAFTNPLSPQLDVTPISFDLADVDLDGDPDLWVTGPGSGGATTSLYLNRWQETGTLNFEQEAQTVPGLVEGQLQAGDYNEDGYADLALVGQTGPGANDRLAVIYQNPGLGGNAFTEDQLASSLLSGVDQGAALAWGDIDADGKLDLAVAGRTQNGLELLLYRNDEPTANVEPTAPINLTNTVEGNTILLGWDLPAGADSLQAAGYTFNLFMGTAADSFDIVSPLAFTKGNLEGFRQLALPGNVGQASLLRVDSLIEGTTYYWGVQAVGPDYEGSVFARRDFAFNPPAFINRTPQVFPGANLPLPISGAILRPADYDNDGDLDLLASGEVDPQQGILSTVLYRNEGGTFVLDTLPSLDLNDLRNSSADWGDFDNDGDLDLVLCGEDVSGTLVSIIYRQLPNGRFAPHAEASLQPVHQGDVAWGDYDNDGDLDLILTGLDDQGSPFTGLYAQDREGNFSLDTEALPSNNAVANSSVAWGDYDGDGYLDLAITGAGVSGAFSRIYHNNGDGTFSAAAGDSPQAVRNSSVAWFDRDNDGDLDLILTGENATSTFDPYTRLYEYQQDFERFRLVGDANLLPLSRGSVAAADFNDDGWMDLLFTGQDGPNAEDRVTLLYRNDGAGVFLEDPLNSGSLTDIDRGEAVWAEFNGDGKIDILLAGRSAASPGVATFEAFINIDPEPNRRPNTPDDPLASVFGPRVTLSWDAPLNEDPATVRGLTYNLYLGFPENMDTLRAGQAALPGSPEDGFRRVVRLGEAGPGRSITFDNLPNGTFVWGVQAVDQDLEGSVFAPGNSFIFENPVPVIVNESFAGRFTHEGDPVLSSIEVLTDTVVEEVIVHYKGIASSTWQQEAVTATGTDRVYSFEVTAGKVDEMGVEYYFEVIGVFGFDAYSDTGYTYLRYPEGFAYEDLTAGEEVSAYNLLSVPLLLDDPSVSSTIEADFGPYDIYEWRAFQYGGSGYQEYQSGFSSLSPGRGFWLITKEARSFTTGAGGVVEANDRAPFAISLQQGWNLIGNPFPYNISWQEVMDSVGTATNDQLGRLYVFGQQFAPSSVLDFRQAGFVFAEQAVSLPLHVRKNPSINRQSAPISYARPAVGRLKETHWELPITLHAAGISYPLGGVGMHPEADTSKDRFDVVRLPRLGQYLDMSHAHPGYFSPYFSFDMVPADTAQVWDFTVGNNTGQRVELRWDPAGLQDGRRRLMLLDVERQQVVDMAAKGNYVSWSELTERPFRIYFGSPAFIARELNPDRIHLGSAYPNPATGPVHIPLALPPAAEPYALSLFIEDLTGRRIARPVAGEVAPGFHTFTWSGQSETGQPVAEGVYLYRVRVKQGHSVYEATGKLIRQ